MTPLLWRLKFPFVIRESQPSFRENRGQEGLLGLKSDFLLLLSSDPFLSLQASYLWVGRGADWATPSSRGYRTPEMAHSIPLSLSLLPWSFFPLRPWGKGNFFFFFLICLFIYLFIYLFWLRWVFIALYRLSQVAASGCYSSFCCAGFSLRWLLLLHSSGSSHTDFSSYGTWAQ